MSMSMSIAARRDQLVQDVVETMTMKLQAAPTASGLWRAQVRAAAAQIQIAIEEAVAADDAAALDAVDVGGHPAWPAAPA